MIQIDPRVLTSEPLSRPALSRFLNRARAVVSLPGEVEVLLTSDAELKRLNRSFRNKNKTTDILSFPTPPEIVAHHAGDLAISLETAARQASQYGHTLADELRVLILHGLLHLSGLDHETDDGQMATRELDLRATLKLPTSLIARANPTKIKIANGQTLSNLRLPTKKTKGPSPATLAQRTSSARAERKRVESPAYPRRPNARPRP